jgi:hypothetical protein
MGKKRLSHIKGGAWTEGVSEQDSEGNILTEEN